MLANAVQVLFYAFLAVLMFGDAICQAVGVRQVPDLIKSLQESKLMYSILGFFIFA